MEPDMELLPDSRWVMIGRACLAHACGCVSCGGRWLCPRPRFGAMHYGADSHAPGDNAQILS